MAIDLMTLDIAAMVTRTLANGVVERADAIWHVPSMRAHGGHHQLLLVAPCGAVVSPAAVSSVPVN